MNGQTPMACYLCGESAYRVLKGAVRDNPSLEVRECSNCRLVTLSSLDHIRPHHYEDFQSHAGDAPSIESYESMESWLRITDEDDQRRFEMLKPLLVNRRILDFGCGAGGFLRKAQPLASDVGGVEPERRVRDHWSDALKLYANLEGAGGGYDLISAFHVLEHLHDPRSILRQLAASLGAGGRLVIEVPSSEDALLTLYESDAFQRFTYWSQHLFLFNPETLRRLATQAGLSVVSIEQIQRYPLSNHLHWLSRGLPGGHQRWSFLDTPALTESYAASLAAMGRCDTIIAHLENMPQKPGAE